MAKTKIGVVGAGVIGLSTAVNIIDHIPNVDVTIMADKFSPNTTGDNSGGFWLPAFTSGDKVRKWSKTTFDYMCDLSRSEVAGRTGAHLISGYQLGLTDADWSDIVFGFRPMDHRELALFPNAKAKNGSFFTTVKLECSMYLPWLMLRFKEKGGKVQHRNVMSLTQLSGEFDLVINCCGLSARELAKDQDVQPLRGQVIKVRAPWIQNFVLVGINNSDPELFSGVLPGAKGVTLCGTTQAGNWNTQVNTEDKNGIWERCLNLFPSLKDATYLYDWAGLRPCRPEIRLELEEMITNTGKPLPVIHNYGHGGAGVTLHWGCALEAVEIARKTIQKYSPTSKL